MAASSELEKKYREELEQERQASEDGRSLPEDLVETIYSYVLFGYSPGGFLESILKNNLYFAVGFCDETRAPLFFPIVRYIRSRLRGDCYGSPEIVNDWMRHGGLMGRATGEED
jgi:hypothetical protein